MGDAYGELAVPALPQGIAVFPGFGPPQPAMRLYSRQQEDLAVGLAPGRRAQDNREGFRRRLRRLAGIAPGAAAMLPAMPFPESALQRRVVMVDCPAEGQDVYVAGTVPEPGFPGGLGCRIVGAGGPAAAQQVVGGYGEIAAILLVREYGEQGWLYGGGWGLLLEWGLSGERRPLDNSVQPEGWRFRALDS